MPFLNFRFRTFRTTVPSATLVFLFRRELAAMHMRPVYRPGPEPGAVRGRWPVAVQHCAACSCICRTARGSDP